jgi:hypothetical protein
MALFRLGEEGRGFARDLGNGTVVGDGGCEESGRGLGEIWAAYLTVLADSKDSSATQQTME